MKTLKTYIVVVGTQPAIAQFDHRSLQRKDGLFTTKSVIKTPVIQITEGQGDYLERMLGALIRPVVAKAKPAPPTPSKGSGRAVTEKVKKTGKDSGVKPAAVAQPPVGGEVPSEGSPTTVLEMFDKNTGLLKD